MSQYSSRKRTRSFEEDSCDLLPISKRINDLHIRSGFPEDASVKEREATAPSHGEITRNNLNIGMPQIPMGAYNRENICNSYEPELGIAENPYYFHANEVLFQAHIQRLQRLSGHPL